MNILVINSGSSSVKYKLFDIKNEKELARGIVERIGAVGHNRAIKRILNSLAGKKGSVLGDISEISAVGHRVVHGGEEFSDPVIITARVIKAIRSYFKLAPLHNPPNLVAIKAAQKLLPKIKHAAVFDTAFHQTIPPSAYLYALPYRFYKKDKIRKYGFHGTSHKYVSLKAAEMLNKPLSKLKLITCHLGNGCSITAVKNGKSVNTSMGFTPLEGLAMGTRSGDIDPAIVFYLMKEKGLSPAALDDLLNKKSGLLGMSGISSDMRDVYKAVKRGNRRAKLAFEVFIDRIQKYIGSYIVAMNGVDAVVFTAGIGENHAPTRKAACRNLSFLGKKVKVLVVPTDEELMIARETYKLITK